MKKTLQKLTLKKELASCLFIVTTLLTITVHAQIITTVAGDGTLGSTGNGGLATSAELSHPNCVAFDDSGNYYIGDETANVVRKVNILTGVISTIAGTGTAGYSGDHGLATLATLDDPIGVAIDANGNIFIGDFSNDVVRKITKSTGIITTIAGIHGSPGFNGDNIQATTAELDGPRYVALDKNGNLYIADAANSRIREIDTTTGIITTVAGDGTASFFGDGGLATSAELDYPYGVALDDSNNIYIADQSNNRVREVRVLTGIINTVAGDGSTTHSGDGSLAISAGIHGPCTVSVAGNGDMFIAATGENTIRKVTKTTGIITTFAGTTVGGYIGDGGLATSEEINEPAGVTLDRKGNFYIPDWGNSRVREVTLAESTTGIQKLNVTNGNISVYPNPANQQLFVAFNGITGQVSITLYNLLGQQIVSQMASANQTFTLNTASLNYGMYLIKIQTEDGASFVRKVEIER